MENKEEFVSFVERIEVYNEQIADCNASKKVIMEEAKAAGFSTKAINYAVRQRKKDKDQRAEEKQLESQIDKMLGL